MMNWIDRVIGHGRLLFGIAVTAFGAEHLVCARFGQKVVPVVPWLSGNHPWLAYFVGFSLVLAGFDMVANLRPYVSPVLLGAFLFACFVALWIPQVFAAPDDLGIRTRALETLTLCGVALILAGSSAKDSPSHLRLRSANILVGMGRYFLGLCTLIFGADHFPILRFIASLIPTWIPFHMFWAWFTGAAFVAAGLSIVTGVKARWGATWLGIMFFLWFVLLHLPRVLSAPRSHDPNEWSSAFIALGICGGSWICASAVTIWQRFHLVTAQAA